MDKIRLTTDEQSQGQDALLRLHGRDQNFLRSLLTQGASAGLTDSQRQWFDKMLKQAGQHVEPPFKSVDVDLWNEDTGFGVKGPLAPAQPAQAPVTLNVTPEQVRNILGPVVEDSVAQRVAEIDANAQQRQARFEKTSARIIADQVLKEAFKKLDERVPVEHVISVRRADDSVKRVEGHTHRKMREIMANVVCGIPTLLVGPAGAGKSTAGEQVARALDRRFFIQGAASGTHEYLGFVDAGGKYHTTPWREAYENGGLFMAEELDSGSADVPLVLNAALANGHMTFPDSPFPVPRHPDFLVIANANTYGLGADRVYVGRTQLDGATIDRFSFIDFDYDEELEKKIAPNADWTAKVQLIRHAVMEEKGRLIVSPRASLYGAQLLSTGLDEPTVMNMVIWKGADKELRRRVEERLKGAI